MHKGCCAQDLYLYLDLRTLRPLTAFKNTQNPKFVQNLSWGLFLRVLVRGTEICQKFEKISRTAIADKFLTNFSPSDWNPQKQSPRQILDKFGVLGFFECCKGSEGSQLYHPYRKCESEKRSGRFKELPNSKIFNLLLSSPGVPPIH